MYDAIIIKASFFYSAVCIILYLPVTLIMVDEFLYDIIIVFGVKPVFFLNSLRLILIE